MDKIKALQYFIASAEEGSFARAARRLGISVPAVQKVVGTLEAAIGVELLERNTRGVRLTPSGAEYLDRCRPLLAGLDDLTQAEGRLKGAGERPSGTLVVAAHPQLAHHIVLPSLPRFHASYPDIEIDFRTVHRIGDGDAGMADVLLVQGWPEVPQEYVHRELGGARMLVMASPAHWAVHGVPRHPSELAGHPCVPMRNPAGILLDLWEFTRGDENVQVPVKGWVSSNAREIVLDMVMGGHGVGRFAELTTREMVRAGRLVPALLEWEVQGGPPINLLYKGSARRAPRLRVFVEHIVQYLRELEGAQGARALIPSDRPAWHVKGYGKASAAIRGRG